MYGNNYCARLFEYYKSIKFYNNIAEYKWKETQLEILI